jgi:hypothetical protein
VGKHTARKVVESNKELKWPSSLWRWAQRVNGTVARAEVTRPISDAKHGLAEIYVSLLVVPNTTNLIADLRIKGGLLERRV